MRILLTFLLLFLATVHLSLGQKLNFKSYSVSEGLPQAQVHDIEQTKDGYIWMATYGGGLARFDGNEFTNYTTKDGLRDNSIEELLVDSKDNIWVASDNGGVARFQGDSLVYPFDNDSLAQYSVVSMMERENGNLWLGTYRGGIFIQKGDTLQRLMKADGLKSNTVWDLMKADNGTVWLATRNGIAIYDEGDIKTYAKSDGLSGNKAFKILERDNGNKWIATSKGISVWDGDSFETITEVNSVPLKSVYDIVEDAAGKLWIGTADNGVFIYDGESYNHITKQNGLNSDYIYNLFKDQNDNIWIGTDEDGVNLYKGDGFVFFNKNTGLQYQKILGVYRDEDNIFWLGTTRGLQSFDGESTQVHPLPDNYENDYIWNITGLPSGNILVAMPDGTLMEYDGQNYTNFSRQYDFGKLFVYDFLLGSDDQLWICTENGLYKLSLRNGQVKHYSMQDGLADETVFNIFEDSRGRKWVGTYYGLNILEDNEFATIRMEDGLVHNQINYITEDDSGDVWVGTRGGVSVFKDGEYREQAEIHNFDKSDGMTLMNTHFLWFDEEGYLWQGTNGGLQRLNVPSYRETGNMSVSHYSLSKNGLGLEFNFNAIDKKAQKAWLGSMEGLVQLDPANLKRHPLTRVDLTKIRANTQPVSWEDYHDNPDYHNGMLDFPSVTFPSSKNIFEFQFRGLSYTNPENVVYRYKLQGFDDDWMPVTSNNSAVYTNLSPGDYTFVVESTYSGGNFTNNRSTYDFAVAYPFYRTYWFYGLVILVLAGLIYAYIRIRVNYLEKNRLKKLVDEQTEHLQTALEEKEVLIKEIHHRVKNNLAVISGLLELQMGHADDFASRVLSESQRRVQSISMIHEKLYQNERLAEINFEKYVHELIDIVSYSFSNPDTDVEVNINIDDFKLGVDQGIPCGLILNELVSNAYEHAFKDQDQGRIEINITESENNLIILSVADDGCGLDEDFDSANADTLGFTLIKTLCKQLETELGIEERENGTKFVIVFEREEAQPKVPA